MVSGGRRGLLIGSATLFLWLGVLGCGNPDVAVVGDWTSNSQSLTTTFKADHTVSSGDGKAFTGTWSLAGKVVTIKPETLGGSSVADFKKQMEPFISANAKTPEDKKKAADGLARLDSGVDLTLSEDGKMLTGEMAGSPLELTRAAPKS